METVVSNTRETLKYVYDFTYYVQPDSKIMPEERVEYELMEILKLHCKKWGFQLEQCPSTGRYHYQGRISLQKKKRLQDMKENNMIPGAHWTSTNKECSSGVNFYKYPTKKDTRVRGPWTDRGKSVGEVVVPRQIREVERLHPWQQRVIDDAEAWNKDQINLVYEPKGGVGKSTIVQYCSIKGVGQVLPCGNEYKDLMRLVMCVLKAKEEKGEAAPKLYFVDVPRALAKQKAHEIYSAIETIKGGYAYDDRYKFEDRHFDCPNIWVFTNKMPDRNLLSERRWRYWQINTTSMDLEEYNYKNEEIAIALPQKWVEDVIAREVQKPVLTLRNVSGTGIIN